MSVMKRLATHKLLVSVDAIVGLYLLATALADQHMATVLPNFVLIRQGEKFLAQWLHCYGEKGRVAGGR